MWLMTTEGFFSVAQKSADARLLTVRSRNREDLAKFLRRYTLHDPQEIVYGKGTDYPYRVELARFEVETALERVVKVIDYPNFKDAVKHRRGSMHADVFGRIWGALLDLEPKAWRRRWSKAPPTVDGW
jgi:hypothetical protein